MIQVGLQRRKASSQRLLTLNNKRVLREPLIGAPSSGFTEIGRHRYGRIRRRAAARKLLKLLYRVWGLLEFAGRLGIHGLKGGLLKLLKLLYRVWGLLEFAGRLGIHGLKRGLLKLLKLLYRVWGLLEFAGRLGIHGLKRGLLKPVCRLGSRALHKSSKLLSP